MGTCRTGAPRLAAGRAGRAVVRPDYPGRAYRRRHRQPVGARRRDGFARDCPHHRHPVLPMLALRDRSRVVPDFLGGFRRFQRSRARRRGGESRLGRGGGWCPRDRLASQVRWSGVLREPCTTDPCQSSGPRSVGFRDGSRQVPEYAASRTSRGTAAEPTSQKLTMTRGARGPAPAGATWRPGAGLGVSRCAHRESDTGMDPCHRPQAGARDPRRATRPTVHRPGHRRRTPRRRAQRATLDPQLRAGAADARPPDRDLPPTQHNLTGGHRRLHRR